MNAQSLENPQSQAGREEAPTLEEHLVQALAFASVLCVACSNELGGPEEYLWDHVRVLVELLHRECEAAYDSTTVERPYFDHLSRAACFAAFLYEGMCPGIGPMDRKLRDWVPEMLEGIRDELRKATAR